MMLAVGRHLSFALSLPERALRAVAALLGGAVHETAALVLPRFVRRSRFYEATARNVLRLTVELVGGVAPTADAAAEHEPDARRLAVRKGAGNAVELGSIAAFGFSPLWLLAGAADVMRGSRVYLDTLVQELKAAGVLREEARFATVDELLGALEDASGTAARLVDVPPLELEGLRRSLAELRDDAAALPSPERLADGLAGLRELSRRERRPLLEVSTGVGLAFLSSARRVGRQHVLDPYAEDLRPVRDEGFGAYAARVARPYADAVRRHLDRERPTLTERGLDRLRSRG